MGRSGRFSSPHFFACAAHIGVVSRSSLTFDCRVHGFNVAAFGVARESRSRRNVDPSCSRSFARPRAANQLIARQLWPFNLRGVCAAYLAKPMSLRVGRCRYGIHAMRDRMNAIAHGLNPIREGMNLAWGTVNPNGPWDESRLEDGESHQPWGESRLEDS